jgi:hypothetical protein
VSVWTRFDAWLHRCRTCAVAGIAGSFLEQLPWLEEVEPLKFGHLVRCAKCGRHWFLQHDRQWLQRVEDGCLPLLQRWNGQALGLDEAALAALAGIGGLEDRYEQCIAVPCSVRDRSGRRHEKSLVLVARQPPIGRQERHRVHGSDEMAAVAASPFALPYEVRRATSEKREQSMGFAPVGVADRSGTEYTLTCTSRFVDRNGIRGRDLHLSGRTRGWRSPISPDPAEAYFFADWFDGCEELLLRGPRA